MMLSQAEKIVNYCGQDCSFSIGFPSNFPQALLNNSLWTIPWAENDIEHNLIYLENFGRMLPEKDCKNDSIVAKCNVVTSMIQQKVIAQLSVPGALLKNSNIASYIVHDVCYRRVATKKQHQNNGNFPVCWVFGQKFKK